MIADKELTIDMVDVISPDLRVVGLLPPDGQLIADTVRERLRFSVSGTKVIFI